MLAHLDPAFDNVDLAKINVKLGGEKSFWTGPSNTFHMYSKDPEVVRGLAPDPTDRHESVPSPCDRR